VFLRRLFPQIAECHLALFCALAEFLSLALPEVRVHTSSIGASAS